MALVGHESAAMSARYTRRQRDSRQGREIASRNLNHEKINGNIRGLLLLGGSAFAGSYRAHYSIKGSGRDVTVQAESSAEARRTVMEMFPGAVVTGVHRAE